MVDVKKRIEECTNQINRRKYAMEQNLKKIKSIKELYVSVIPKLNDSSKEIINGVFPEFLDEEYVNSLDTMSYDEQMEFILKLDSLIDVLLNDVEEFLK